MTVQRPESLASRSQQKGAARARRRNSEIGDTLLRVGIGIAQGVRNTVREGIW